MRFLLFTPVLIIRSFFWLLADYDYDIHTHMHTKKELSVYFMIVRGDIRRREVPIKHSIAQHEQEAWSSVVFQSISILPFTTCIVKPSNVVFQAVLAVPKSNPDFHSNCRNAIVPCAY